MMTAGGSEVLYRKCCSLAEDLSDSKDSFQHLQRLISFVVGIKVRQAIQALLAS